MLGSTALVCQRCPRISAPSLPWLLPKGSLGLVYDNVGGEAFYVLLFWIEDVGLREWLDGDGCHGNPGL